MEANLDDNLLDELGQAGVDIVDNDTDALYLAGFEGPSHMARHVLLQHGLDVPASLLVAGEDGLAPEQTALLGAVPVELKCVGVLALDDLGRLKNDAERLEDGDGTAAIVISTRRSEDAGEPQVDGILMRANDDRRICLAGDGGDDGVLAPGVFEMLSRDVLVCAGGLDGFADLAQEPFAGLPPVVGLYGNDGVRELPTPKLSDIGRESLTL